MSDPELLAYHEAGHVVVACEVGGRVLSASIDPDSDGGDVEREADVVIEWPNGRSPKADVWVALAGPAAETIYEGHAQIDGELLTAWSGDWRAASDAVARMYETPGQRLRHLRASIADLDRLLRRDDVWAVVGDVADALLAHEHLDEDLLADVLGPWGMDA